MTEQPKALWHMMSALELLTRLSASENGLTNAEAKARLELYGRNRLPQKPPGAWWEIVLRQFSSPLIYILTIAAVVSAIAHPEDLTDAFFIAAVLVIGILGNGRSRRQGLASFILDDLSVNVLGASEDAQAWTLYTTGHLLTNPDLTLFAGKPPFFRNIHSFTSKSSSAYFAPVLPALRMMRSSAYLIPLPL